MTRAEPRADHEGVRGEQSNDCLGCPTVQVVAVQRVAQAALTGFALCEDCGLGLNARQKVALLTAAMLELDGLGDELETVLQVERLIAELGRSDRD